MCVDGARYVTYNEAMNSVEDIILEFGSGANFARAIGISVIHANTMKRRRSIPVRHWTRTIEAASDRGIALSLEDLVRIHGGSDRGPAPTHQEGAA